MHRHNFTLNILDITSVLIIGIVLFYYKFSVDVSTLPRFIVVMMVGIVLLNVIFTNLKIYAVTKYVLNASYIYTILKAWSLVILVLFGIAFATKTGHYISREWAVYWVLGSFVFFIINRWIYYLLVSARYIQNNQDKSILIVGSGSLVDRIVNLHSSQGMENIFYYPYPDNENTTQQGVKIIQQKDLDGVTSSQQLDGIWITLPLTVVNHLTQLTKLLQNVSVPVRYVPDISALRIINNIVTDVDGMPVISLTETPMYGFNRVIKWCEDKLLALLIVILVSPVLLIAALLVKLSSPGPVIYHQERMGWNGKKFNMYKFRTMPVDVEKDGVVWGAKSKKATWFGDFLRRTSIDELPQFFNVLRGDMSIVGPRPERPMFVDEFKKQIPGYMQKHLVKAGITGWAQINGWRGDTDLNKRIEYDLYYIENWSLWFDIKVIIMTIFKGFINKNAY